jgi:hypothetical protein
MFVAHIIAEPWLVVTELRGPGPIPVFSKPRTVLNVAIRERTEHILQQFL